MSRPKVPRVSIGMPIYNGAATVARALDSLLGQSFTDFELIISNNASDDGTSEILNEYARRDARILLTEQEGNIGPQANFGFVLKKATAPYFMWAAADDYWAPRFIECNLQFLEENLDYVSSISKAKLTPAPARRREARDETFALAGELKSNMRRFLLVGGANIRFYGLHRRAALLSAWSDEVLWGGDLIFTLRLLRQGKQHQVNDLLFTYNTRGMGALAYDGVRKLGLGFIDTWIPYLRFTFKVIEMPELRWSPKIWATLAYRNVHLFLHMIIIHSVRSMGAKNFRRRLGNVSNVN